MFSRSPNGRLNTILCYARTTRFERTRLVGRLSQVTQRYQRAPPGSLSQRHIEHDTKAGNDGGRWQPKESAIRPITLFAICIPLGYVINWAVKREGNAASLDADGFVAYTLAGKEDVSSTCSVFTLRPVSSSSIRSNDPSLGRIVTSVQLKQPQLQIARDYTLLPPKQDQDPQELRLLIRKEQNGEVSGYLHRLQLGAEIKLRGLNAEYVLPENVDAVLFLAGGTGIAPAMQVANALVGIANVHILWATRRREDCVGGTSDTTQPHRSRWDSLTWLSPFGLPSVDARKQHVATLQETGVVVSELQNLKQRSASSTPATRHAKLAVDYYVDEEGTFIRAKDVSQLLQSVPGATSGSGKKLLFVSGPEGFLNSWAGSKQWVNGREVQGKLSGVLSTLDLTGWDVVKL